MPHDLVTSWPDMAAKAAFYCACNAVTILDEKLQSLDWPACGDDGDRADPDGEPWTRTRVQTALATFAAMNPGAPAEALYRFAGARGIHGADHGGWDDLERPWRLAYQVFMASLPLVETVLRDEAALEARARAPAPAASAETVTRIPALGGGIVERPRGIGDGLITGARDRDRREEMKRREAEAWEQLNEATDLMIDAVIGEAEARAEAEAAAAIGAETERPDEA